ncbi:MAG: hypothetical protein PUC65_00960 [Clostridiales bacterium]|nr:hypothetical protein [Clostridiales bacterium]
MQKILCLNLAEMMNGIYEKDGTFMISVSNMLAESGYSRFTRVYIGSSFCAIYFLHASTDMIKSVNLVCEKEQCKMTLVLPIFTEKYLDKAKEQIKKLVDAAGVYLDEITVNDFGMLEYIHNNYKQKINLGRLFMKDYRDKRYSEYFHSCVKPKIFNITMLELMKQYNIHGVELDLTHEKIDLSEAPSNLTIGFHYPYCYQTVGHICEIGSTNQSIDKKYRANYNCSFECESQIVHYTSEEGGHYLKHGRAVYFENPDCNIMNAKQIRLIYTSKQLGGEK